MPAVASGGIVKTYGAVAGSNSIATSIAASASANTKGAAVQLTAATEFDATWMVVSLTGVSTNTTYLVDILAGAATETVIVPDLFVFGRASTSSWPFYSFPISVPKGTRLAARCQAATGAATIRVAVTLISGGPFQDGPPPPGIVSAYGATASSKGTNIDPGGVAHADSAWVEIAAATERDHHWLMIGGQFGDGALTGAPTWRMDVGIGAATEAELIPDLHFSADVTSDFPFNPVVCLPCYVPRGSRLTARARCNATTDGDRDIDVKIYGAG